MIARAFFVLLSFSILPSLLGPQDKPGKPRAELRVSAPSPSYYLGEPVPIRVEIANLGSEDFYVGRRFSFAYDHPSQLIVEVDGGTPAESMTEWLHPQYAKQWWVPLEPGHILGTEVLIDPSISSNLAGAGKHRITARYVSRGGSTLANPTEGIASSEVWRGELRSNSIWIEILPRRTHGLNQGR